MGFTYPDKFSYLNTFMIELAQRCSNNGGPTVIEYGNIIWGPQYIQDQQEIEKVQRRATKLIRDLQNHTYDDRLAYLTLPSLKY